MDNSVTAEKDVISVMAKFNLKNPFSVTVIFDEDDDKIKKRNVRSSLNSNRKRAATCNQKGVNEEAMLNKVAHNMAGIMESYFTYMKLATTTTDANLINSYKTRLTCNKSFYFNESLTISKTILLPQEKNKDFFNRLIHKSIRILKVHPQIAHYKLKLLYNDLLEWTKHIMKKRLDVCKKKLYQSQPVPGPCSQPYVTPANISNCNDNIVTESVHSQRPNALTLFSAGPPGNEITINVDPKYLWNKNTNNDSVQYHTTSQRNIQNSTQTSLTAANKTCTSILPNKLKEKTLQKSCLDQTSCQRPGNLESININTTTNNDTILNIKAMQTNEHNIVRRSISRDSGIISPDMVIASSDTMNSRTLQPVYQTTQIIGDASQSVIPNNSNNVFTLRPLCFVCRKATNLLCLGCFTYYYCSTTCQKVHWEVHKWICHLIPKSNDISAKNYFYVT